MYSAADFAWMIADRVRMGAYEEALRRAVKPGCVVVDVGTGTGIFALLSCKLGARHVYAIDPNPAIEVAKETAKRNGFGDRITFFRAFSTDVDLPEKADVLVSDLRGTAPLFGKHLVAIADARERFLKEGGAQIPERDVLFVAPVELPGFYEALVGGCRSAALDLSPLRRAILDAEHPLSRGAVLTEASLLAEPVAWATLDYTNAASLDARGLAAFVARRSGMAHGLALWFSASLAPGVGYDNGPDTSVVVYKPLFLPWSEPTWLSEGDCIEVQLAALYAREGYLWEWNTSLAGTPRFKQTNFAALGPSPALLRASSPDRIPGLSRRGEAAQRALDGLRAGLSVRAAAEQGRNEFPELFSSLGAALDLVQRLAREYGGR